MLGIETDNYRILNDKDDPVLYEPELFHVIDESIPAGWVTRFGEGEERYAGSGDLPKYVWEDYHDSVPEAVAAIQAYLERVQPCSWRIGRGNE